MEKALVARNTIILYARMLLSMFLSLLISRLILKNLGAMDYGIYGVVGSIVTLFAFLNQALVTAGQRCIAHEYGKENSQVNKLVITIFIYCVIVAFSVLGILLLLGKGFVAKLNIPLNRRIEAEVVFYYSSLAFFFSIISIPFTSYIVASQKFGLYAFLSIVDVIFRLIAVVLIVYLEGDVLINYSLLLMIISLMLLFLNYLSTRKNIKLKLVFDKSMFKDVGKYFGWNLFGGVASISLLQGLQILLNLFFNPIVNAAQSLSNQLKSAVDSFASNIRTASSPSIIKLCSSNSFGEAYEMLNLVIRLSSVTILLVSIPLLLETDLLLKLWLNDVPPYTNIFIKLLLFNMIIDVVSSPIVSVIQSIGDIKKYQLTVSFVILLVLPFSYLLFSFGYDAYFYGYLLIISSFVTLGIRVLYLKDVFKMSVKNLLKNMIKQIIIFPIIIIAIISFSSNFIISDLWRLFFVILFTFILVLSFSYYFLFKPEERKRIIQVISRKFFKSRINE